MSTKVTGQKASYIRHSAEYKQEALQVGGAHWHCQGGETTGLHESQLYAWRKQSEHAQTISERESSLAAENARLKRQLAQRAEELSILTNAAIYFAQQLKRGTAT